MNLRLLPAFAAAVAVAVVVVAGSGCSLHADEPRAASTPSISRTLEPQASTTAGPDTSYDVHCLSVPADLARRIASGAREGVEMVPGMAVAVKSPVEDVYVVAMQFEVSGATDTQLGFWAVSTSLTVHQHGRILAVGRSAQHFTTWPHVWYSSADVRRSAKWTVGDSAACLLK